MSTRKNTSAQGAQMEQMMEQMMQMMQMMNERISALEDAPKAQATPKAQPKARKDGKVAFTKKDGTVIYGTAKQVAQWERYRDNASKPLTDAQVARKEAIAESKEKEPERTRALEKALKVKAGSFENTAITLKEALDAGWKPKASDRAGRRAELKAIKAKVRA